MLRKKLINWLAYKWMSLSRAHLIQSDDGALFLINYARESKRVHYTDDLSDHIDFVMGALPRLRRFLAKVALRAWIFLKKENEV